MSGLVKRYFPPTFHSQTKVLQSLDCVPRTRQQCSIFLFSWPCCSKFKYFYELQSRRETPPSKKYSTIASFSRPHFANTFGCPVLPSYFLLLSYFFSTNPTALSAWCQPLEMLRVGWTVTKHWLKKVLLPLWSTRWWSLVPLAWPLNTKHTCRNTHLVHTAMATIKLMEKLFFCKKKSI